MLRYGVPDGQAVQTIISYNAAFQTEDLDTYDSDCDDYSNAKAVLMANISNYGSDVISEVPHSETYLNDIPVMDFTDNEIHSDSSIIPYSQYLQETQQENVQDTNLQAQQDLMILSVIEKMSEQMINHFDSVVKKRTTHDARTEGEWGFEHTKAVFNNEIILFLKSLKNIFNVFDKDLLNKIMEVQTVFDQMDAAVQQSSVDKQCLEIAKKELLLENDRLLQQIMSQDVLLTVMNYMSLIGESVNMEIKRNESCDKCFNLDAELLKSQNASNNLLKSYSQLEKHCISLELSIQLNQEIFQKDESCNNQNALEILEFLKNNDLKAQLQDKDTTILKCSTSNCGSKPTGNKKNDRISRTPSRNMKNKVEAQPRKVNKKKSIVEPIHDVDVKHSLLNTNSEPICATCRTFTIVGNSFPLTRITSANVVSPKKTTSDSVETQKPELKVYSRKPKNVKNVGSSKKAKIVESKNANHTEPNHTWGSNGTDIPSSSSFVMTVRFGNDHIARIMGYGDYQLGNVTISRVYYVEGLGHNLFSVGQFCDADLEVAFWKNTCFIRNLESVDLLSGSRDTNLYTISLDDMLKTSLICLLSKASKTKSCLWHRRLLHLNFGTLNKLAKDGLARGIPQLKFQKDHLCSACALGKSKKTSHQPKAEDTNQEKLYLLHIDLCVPMCVASINGKMYILVIVDDYSRFTWVRFLKTKDEAPEAIIKCIKNIQVRLNAIVHNVRTNNETEFVNQILREFTENVGISHQTSVARTPQQNDVVERRS
ncbi:retrovirus-related pol polyprotein from transposon TNT 1-94 [Tanacetum coccineum]